VVRADLLTDAAALLRPEWLAAQRWFGARDRTIAGVVLADAAPMPLARGELDAFLLLVDVTFTDGGLRRYLVPAVGAEGEPLREPADGDGVWRGLVAAIATRATLPGGSGAFRCEPLPALEALAPGAADAAGSLAERRLGVEQSNTSATVGDALILKVYRRLEPGENPEVEMGTFLESVGCPVTPRMAGAIRHVAADGTMAAAAMLQERVAARSDAWAHLLAQLRGEAGDPVAALDSAAAIGTVTARLHASLSVRPRDLAFPVRPATPAETRALHDGALAQLDAALAATTGGDADRLRALAPAIRERMGAALGAVASPRMTRIHGDYHLGQLLRTADGFVVIDFEGEPARPLAERRMPQPPERDVAGMLRSLDYAVRTVARGPRASALDPDGWLARARTAFLDRYSEAAPSAPDPSLVTAFELEKACYEVRYEAANRPDWSWLPLDALARLA
jgi:trehalose synthase-fused probable maltokinase